MRDHTEKWWLLCADEAHELVHGLEVLPVGLREIFLSLGDQEDDPSIGIPSKLAFDFEEALLGHLSVIDPLDLRVVASVAVVDDEEVAHG